MRRSTKEKEINVSLLERKVLRNILRIFKKYFKNILEDGVVKMK